MRLEKYKVNSENIYIILESNGDYYTAKDFKKSIFYFENNIFKFDFNTTPIDVFSLYKENIVVSKEYNTIEELKLDHIEELIWNWKFMKYLIHQTQNI